MKKRKPVNRELFCRIINDLDGANKFVNRSELFQNVANDYNKLIAENGEFNKINASLVYLRIKEWNLKIKTEKAKVGGGLAKVGGGLAKVGGELGGRVKLSRKEKFSKNSVAQQSFDLINKRTPERFKRLAMSAQKGSRSSAVKLHCLECSGWMTAEVRKCPVLKCALWAYRPYQGKSEPEEVGAEPVAEMAE